MLVEGSSTYQIISLENLRVVLKLLGINYLLWQAGRKNERHLFEEIENGETQIVSSAEQGLVRQTHVLKLEVRYVDSDGVEYILVEDRQEWHSKFDALGEKKIDRRGFRHISEKIKSSEVQSDGRISDQAIYRALKEELGVSYFDNLSETEVHVEYEESPSYPGLKTKYVLYNCRVYLPEKEYREVYIEEGKEKNTYFIWERVSES